MRLPGVIIEAGDPVVCPRCWTALAYFVRSISRGDSIYHNDLEYLNPAVFIDLLATAHTAGRLNLEVRHLCPKCKSCWNQPMYVKRPFEVLH